MSVMIQIRNVPDQLHREFKARAAKAGMSLSDYLLRELEYCSQTLPFEELVEVLKTREPVNPDISAAEIVRQERDSR